MKRKRNRVLDYAVYLAVRFTVFCIRGLPIKSAYALASGLAGLAYRVDKRHRRVALENLENAFGAELDPQARERIVLSVYRHFFKVLMEIAHISGRLGPTNWRDRVRLANHEPILNRLLDGGPLIFVTGHFGNWEMAGYLFGVFGFPTHSVARDLDNPELDRFLKSFRGQTGQKLINKKGGYDDMLAVLKSGGALSFLADQDAGQNGMFVNFFGRPASTHKAIALLAIEHNAPVAVGYARRLGDDFYYEVGCEEVIAPGELTGGPEDALLLTQRYTAAIERIIRRDPDQYLWLHRRWKHAPRPKRARGAANRPEPETEPEPPAPAADDVQRSNI